MESEQESENTSDPATGLNVYQRIREIKRELFGIKQKKHTMGFSFMSHDGGAEPALRQVGRRP